MSDPLPIPVEEAAAGASPAAPPNRRRWDWNRAAWLLIAAAGVLAVPYLVLISLGAVWMYQHGLIWYWVLATTVTMGLGLPTGRWALGRLLEAAPGHRQPQAATLAEEQARQAVQAIARRVRDAEPDWHRPETIIAVLREVLESVAGAFYPEARQPVLETRVTDTLRLVELMAADLREAFARNVPLGHQVTLAQLEWLNQKRQVAWRLIYGGWQLYRVARFFTHPTSAIFREAQDRAGQHVMGDSVQGVRQWAIEFAVNRLGEYAIDLYGHNVLPPGITRQEETPQAAAARAHFADREAIFVREPLQVLVLGQPKVGKSSLINALVGKPCAPVDVARSDEQLDLYPWESTVFGDAVLREAPGYQGSVSGKHPFERLQEVILQSDLLLMVCPANSAARRPDAELIARLREYYQQNIDRLMPPLVVALTHADRLPVDLVPEAAAAVAEDLHLPTEDVVPLCVRGAPPTGVDELLIELAQLLPQAQRAKDLRVLRSIREERDYHGIVAQLLQAGRTAAQWLRTK